MGFQVFPYITSLVWMRTLFLPPHSSYLLSLLSQHLQGSQRNGEDSSKALIFNLEENKCLSCLIIHGIPWCGLMMPWVSRGSRLSGAGHLCIWLLLMAKCFLPLSCVSFLWPQRENNAEDVLVCALTYQGQSLVLFPLQVAHWSQVSSCLYHTGRLIERGFLSTEALTTHTLFGMERLLKNRYLRTVSQTLPTPQAHWLYHM